MLRSVNEESAEETRKEHIVQSAISTLILSQNWKRSFIFLMNWMVQKESWLQVRLQTEWESPVL